MQECIESLDDQASHITHEGKVRQRSLRAPKTVTTTMGTVTWLRSGYRRRGERQSCPVDARPGLCAGAMTPPAAPLAVHMVTQQTLRGSF